MAAPRFRYYVAAGLDGFIADAEGELDWLLAFGFEEFQAHYDAFLASVGAVVMGRSTLDGGVPVLALGDGHRRLVLERTTPFPSGAIELRYRVAR